ncbi:hypothetical protein AB4084_31115, partial [Lysobacter sp. 2RAB21]
MRVPYERADARTSAPALVPLRRAADRARPGPARAWSAGPMSELPIIVVPVGVDDDALDACLAALE